MACGAPDGPSHPKSLRMPEKVRKITTGVEGFEGTDECGSIGEYLEVVPAFSICKGADSRPCEWEQK